jgi:O-antigen ligase
MVSTARHPLHPLALAALLLAPIAGAASVSSGSVPLGLAAAAFCWASWNWPREVLLGILLCAPVSRSWNAALLPPLLIAQVKTAAALTLGVVAWFRGAVARQDDAFPNGLFAFFAAWAAITALVLAHSIDVGQSLEYLSLTGAGVGLFAVCYAAPRGWQRRALSAALLVGGAIGLIVVLQYTIVVYHHFTFLERFIVEPRTQAYFDAALSPMEPARYRPTGTMTHPNGMGLYFAMLIPYAVALLRARAIGRWERVGIAVATLLMALGLYATNSRAAIVFAAVALLALAFHRGYRSLWAGVMAAVIALAMMTQVSNGGAAVLRELVAKARVEAGLSGRDIVWRNAADLVRHSWVLGVGPGNFSHQYVSQFGFFVPHDLSEQSSQIWAIQMLGDKVVDNFHAHNIYLQLLGESGLGGVLIFLTGMALVLWHSRRQRRAPLRSYPYALSAATTAAAIALMVYGFFDSQMAFTAGSLNLIAGPLLAFGLQSGPRESIDA